MTEPLLYCYRYQAWDQEVDYEQVWSCVDRWGGQMQIRASCIDFYVPVANRLFFELAWPELARQPSLDLF